MKSIFKLSAGSMLVGLAVLMAATQVNAQLTEAEVSEYVMAESFLLVSINMDSLRNELDKDHPVMKKFRERDAAGPYDFNNVAQYLTFVAKANGDSENQFEIPGGAMTRFEESIDPEKWLEQASQESYLEITYEAEEYGDHEIFVGQYNDAMGGMVGSGIGDNGDGSPSCFFPSENIAVTATFGVAKRMIDERDDDDSMGKDLAGNLDSDADFHLLMNKGSNITDMPVFGMMEAGIPVPNAREILESIESVELIGDMDQMTPVKGTIECSSADAAEELEELIKTGLQAVPALIMMTESQLDAAFENEGDEEIMEDLESEMRAMLKLAITAAKELEITRNDDTLELQLGNVEGLDKLPGTAMLMIAAQSLEMEKFRKEFAEGGFGEIEMIEDLEEAKKAEDDDGK